MNYSECVKEFTAKTCDVPATPSPMTRAEVMFIVRMVISELGELVQTVEEYENTKEFLMEAIATMDLSKLPKPENDTQLIGDQGDALVDAMYYMENAAVKKGINLSGIFRVVHAANMDKFRNGVIKRSDGKIMKPADWKEPDIYSEIERQKKSGSW